MRSFYFLRHGQTDWNLTGRMQGHTDIPLNATGIAQAHAASLILKNTPFDRIIASTLSRAKQTAHIVAEASGKPLTLCPNLKERTFGNLEGQLWQDVLKRLNLPEDSRSLRPEHYPDDAEQWPDIVTRSHTTITHWLAQHPDETLLFVSHGAFFRALLESLNLPEFYTPNATPYHFQAPSDGQTSWHLQDLTLTPLPS